MMHIFRARFAIFLLLQLAFAASTLGQPNNATSKRVVYYYQTQFANGDTGSFYSLLPLVAKANLDPQGKPYTTDVLVGAFHLGPESDKTNIHLNDFPPNNSIYATLWQQTAVLQSKGININMYLGGGEDESFANLVSNFSYYYPVLKQTLKTYNFSGIDLDVEDGVETTAEIETLIKQLRSDFGQKFIITLAPVATDLMADGGGLSNINYKQLFTDLGSNISWFNVQFYSGFGTLASTSDYTAIIENGFPANVVVGGMLSNSSDGASNGGGFVDIPTVENTVSSLLKQYPTFGGVDAFEYFNAAPGGEANPAEWGTVFGKLLGT